MSACTATDLKGPPTNLEERKKRTVIRGLPLPPRSSTAELPRIPPLPGPMAPAKEKRRHYSVPQTLVDLGRPRRPVANAVRCANWVGRELLLLVAVLALSACIAVALFAAAPMLAPEWMPVLLAGAGGLVFVPLLPLARRMSRPAMLLVFPIALAATWAVRLGVPLEIHSIEQALELWALPSLTQHSPFALGYLALLGAEALVFAVLLVGSGGDQRHR